MVMGNGTQIYDESVNIQLLYIVCGVSIQTIAYTIIYHIIKIMVGLELVSEKS